MITLTRYFSLKLFWSALGVTLVFTALVQILDLLDATEDVLKIGEGAAGFAFYIVMRLPSIIPEVMPLSVLIAVLFTLAVMVRNGEIVAMKAAGVRVEQIIGAMVPAVLLLALAHYAIGDQLRPSAERRLTAWWSENAVATGGKADSPVWMKVDNTIIRIDRVHDRGRRLEGVRIYDRDERDAVAARTVAAVARYKEAVWTFSDAVTTDWRRDHVNEVRPANGTWTTRLKPNNVLEAMSPETHVSVSAAREALAGRRLAISAPSVYATAIQRAFAEPVTDLVMLLLAAPLAAAHWRGGAAPRFFLLCLGAGLLFLLTDGLTATLGRAGVVPPVAAAWAPALVFAALALGFLQRLQRP